MGQQGLQCAAATRGAHLTAAPATACYAPALRPQAAGRGSAAGHRPCLQPVMCSSQRGQLHAGSRKEQWRPGAGHLR